jgi:hypothetical protein
MVAIDMNPQPTDKNMTGLLNETFEALLGKSFEVRMNGCQSIFLVLTKVQVLPTHPLRTGEAPKRTSFSLIFRGVPEYSLPQGSYSMETECFPPTEIFLVPIGPDSAGHRYEAVFN